MYCHGIYQFHCDIHPLIAADKLRGEHQGCHRGADEARRHRLWHVFGGVHHRGPTGGATVCQVSAGPGVCVLCVQGKTGPHEEVLHLLDNLSGAVHHRLPQDPVPTGCWIRHSSDYVPSRKLVLHRGDQELLDINQRRRCPVNNSFYFNLLKNDLLYQITKTGVVTLNIQ